MFSRRHLAHLWIAVVSLHAVSAHAQAPGSLDPVFYPDDGLDNAVFCVAVQPDGKILAGGSFALVGNIARNKIARFNLDGSLDMTFNPGSSGVTDNAVSSVQVQPDGKVLLCGTFTRINGVSRPRIARLNADGSLDASFDPGAGADTGSVQSMAFQQDGKIIIAGSFTMYNKVARNYLARINANGGLDTSFDPGTGPNAALQAATLQPDGKVLVGGAFTAFNGTARNDLARLNTDGSLDTAFDPGNNLNSAVTSMALQTDGKVLLGGLFTKTVGSSHYNDCVARLNADGSLDTGFNLVSVPSGANAVVVQADGKILVGGNFNSFGGTLRTHLARLNADGSVDTGFDNSPYSNNGANATVNSVVVQSDGKVILGGSFTLFHAYGRGSLARANTDGSVDTAFNPGGGVSDIVAAITLQPDGKALIAGRFRTDAGFLRNGLGRHNTDGSLDTAFVADSAAVGTGTGFVSATTVQTDGKIVVGGSFTTSQGAKSNGIARLNADGSIDAGYNAGDGCASVYSLVLQPDNKAVLVGSFATYNYTNRKNIARVNTDGSLDTTFNPGSGADNTVHSVALQPDGRILIGGDFAHYNGTTRPRLARLNADGSLDTSFDPGTGPDNTIVALAVQADGKVLIGGNFSVVNGASHVSVARLNADGSVDATFNASLNGMVYILTTQPDGKVLAGGTFTAVRGAFPNGIARLNADGSLDTTFAPTGASAIYSLGLQTDGKILVGGGFTTINGVARNNYARLFPDTPPAILAGAADTTQPDGTVLHVAANPNGLVTTGFFQYGLTTDYGSTTATQSLGAGADDLSVSATLHDLSADKLYHYRLVATNSAGTTTGADIPFTPLTTAESWRQKYFGAAPNTGVAADAADPDGDGIVNFLERALGLDPTTAGLDGLPAVARDASGRLVLTAHKGAYISDLIFSAEVSEDLMVWTTVGTTVLEDDANTFQARDDGAAGPRRFLRLRVVGGQAGSLSVVQGVQRPIGLRTAP